LSKTTIPDPLISDKRSTALKDRDFSLYVDGLRVVAEPTLVLDKDGLTIHVSFRTTSSALDGAAVVVAEEIAWGGWSPGDSCHLRQPSKSKYPTNGYVQIRAVRRPRKAGDEAMFEVYAMTPIYDYEAEVEICPASEYALVPASWFQR
jgi:hypothetical protein